MNREELKDALKKVCEQCYHEGFADACDVIAPALTESITSVVAQLKEKAQEAEAEIIDDHEEME